MRSDDIVKYRSMSHSMSSANLKTSTLRITTMLSWTWSMSSTTWRNQICHTTIGGWCGAWPMIVSPNISKSFGNCPKSRFWVRQCHVHSHRRAGKPVTWRKRISLYKTFWRALSHGSIRFFVRPREYGFALGVRKSCEISWNPLRNPQNPSELHNWRPPILPGVQKHFDYQK